MSGGGGGFSSTLQPVSTAVGGTLSGLFGTAQVADATGQIAGAQFGQQQADRSAAMQMMAPTQAEIQQLQQAMSVNQQNINQGQQLINSADPALMAAGKQALDLMNGGSAAALGPIQNQRAQQRSQLQSQLQQQLGTGYATSSAGMEALNNFDQQTSNLMTNAQQSTLQQFLGVSQGAHSQGAQQQQMGINNYMTGNNQQYGWQQGQANALMGTPVNPGLQYTGQLANAQANSQFMSGLMGMGWQNRGSMSNLFGGSGGASSGAGSTAMAGGPMDAGAFGGGAAAMAA